MSMNAQTLTEARKALITAHAERINLIGQVKEQGRKIFDLEREVQKQANLKSQAEQALSAARTEIETLRAQVPDDATLSAYDSLVQYMTSPAEIHTELRIAA